MTERFCLSALLQDKSSALVYLLPTGMQQTPNWPLNVRVKPTLLFEPFDLLVMYVGSKHFHCKSQWGILRYFFFLLNFSDPSKWRLTRKDQRSGFSQDLCQKDFSGGPGSDFPTPWHTAGSDFDNGCADDRDEECHDRWWSSRHQINDGDRLDEVDDGDGWRIASRRETSPCWVSVTRFAFFSRWSSRLPLSAILMIRITLHCYGDDHWSRLPWTTLDLKMIRTIIIALP